MDAPAADKTPKINRWLPYLAVFQADVRQTLRSWVYRTWVLAALLTAGGYLIYHVGGYHKAGMVQLASTVISDVLLWTVLGSITLIIVLTVGSISGERGTMADSILSRGISRYQYFLAKLHARLVSVIGTFLLLGVLMLVASFVFLQQDLSLLGSLVALFSVAAMLMAVITCGVTFSAVSNSTLAGITVLWIIVHAAGVLLTLLPSRFPSPYKALSNLPHILQGHYSLHDFGQLAMWSAVFSCLVALFGMGYFSRRDV